MTSLSLSLTHPSPLLSSTYANISHHLCVIHAERERERSVCVLCVCSKERKERESVCVSESLTHLCVKCAHTTLLFAKHIDLCACVRACVLRQIGKL